MTKIISLTALHYGKDYLEWALRSVRDSVEECWVLYTPVGSFGFQSELHCPDRENDLLEAAYRGAGDKLKWHKGYYPNEGLHRDAIFSLCKDFDYMMVVDSDEIWQAGLVEDVVRHFEAQPDQRSLRILATHYWRTFHRGIPNDGLFAEHGWANRPGITGAYLESDKRIHHFGYSQCKAVTRYKIDTHGHRMEWRAGWFDNKFAANAQIDVHPVIFNLWNPVNIDPYALGLPEFMREHPYANLELIDP